MQKIEKYVDVKIKMKWWIILIFLFLYKTPEIFAQQKSVTQEEVELENLNKYEEKKPAVPPISLVTNNQDEFLYGARIQRFMTLLESSNKNRRLPVSILIYGQSITGSQIFTEELNKYLREKYPYVVLSIENRSIGGFGGERLVRTSIHDLYDVCYDLIVFHVYGGEKHGELETIFSNIRKHTTAEILLLNHHISSDKTVNYDESSYLYLNYIANKYNCELVDVTKEWAHYLVDNNLKTEDLLRDVVHPNRWGNWLLVQLMSKHFRLNNLFPSDWYKQIQTYYVNSVINPKSDSPIRFKKKDWDKIGDVYYGINPENTLILEFEGNRVDIIPGLVNSSERLGSARIWLDGKPLSKNSSLYAITRPSAGQGTWWPLIRRVEHSTDLIPETWTMRIDQVNPDSTLWMFSVYGSKTGYDGSGNSNEDFVSKSGRVIIHKDDYMFKEIKNSFNQVTKPGFEVKWEVRPLFNDIYHAIPVEDPSIVYKIMIVHGLPNEPHVLEIIPVGDGIVPIEAIEIHRPPLID